MLPPLATLADFEKRLPGGVLTSDDYARAEATLQDASALVRAEANTTWVDTDGNLTAVPDVIVMVTLAVARRAFVNPDGLTSESIQDYQASFANSSSDLYLTKSERDMIRRAVGRTALWTLATTRSDVGPDVPTVTRTSWRNVPEETDPFGEGWA